MPDRNDTPILDGDLRKGRDRVIDRLDELDGIAKAREAALARLPEKTQPELTLGEIDRGDHDHVPLNELVDKLDKSLARAREKAPHMVLEIQGVRERLIARRTGPIELRDIVTVESLVATIEKAAEQGETEIQVSQQQARAILIELASMARMTNKRDYERKYRRAAYDGDPVEYINREVRELFGVRLVAVKDDVHSTQEISDAKR